MHSKLKGDIGELIVAQELLTEGWHIAFPYGENLKYDLIAEKCGRCLRIQVKAVMPRNGALRINCRSSNNWSATSYTQNDFEILAAVDLSTKNTYYISSRNLGKSLINLRIDKSKNSQEKGIRLAERHSTIESAICYE